MYAAKYVFTKPFFAAWIVVAIIWVWGTMLVAGFFPIIDGRRQLTQVWRALAAHEKLKDKTVDQPGGTPVISNTVTSSEDEQPRGKSEK